MESESCTYSFTIINDHIVGMTSCSVDSDIMNYLFDIECPYMLWEHLSEIYGDPHISPFIEDPIEDCIFSLENTYCIHYDHGTYGMLELIKILPSFDESKLCLSVLIGIILKKYLNIHPILFQWFFCFLMHIPH